MSNYQDDEPLAMMSFAQNEPENDQPATLVDLSFAALEQRRDGKISGKKSALYKKIMREHNLPINSSNNKLNYNIENLAFRDLSHQKPKQTLTKLTETKPFEFETIKRA
jgi:hypothetical protein